MDVLSARQEKILLQLEKFKDQLTQIRSGLNVCAKPAQHNYGTIKQKDIDVGF